MLIAFELALAGDAHAKEDVITQVTTSLFSKAALE
jgi:hypothetical protein